MGVAGNYGGKALLIRLTSRDSKGRLGTILVGVPHIISVRPAGGAVGSVITLPTYENYTDSVLHVQESINEIEARVLEARVRVQPTGD